MSENEQHHNNNTFMENTAAPIIKESIMKCGWCQTINNTVHYYQKLFNIALILELASNYNKSLREQMSMEKVSWMKQNNTISNENNFSSKLCATDNECKPNRFEGKTKMMI